MATRRLKADHPIDRAPSAANLPRPAGPVMGPPRQHERGKGLEMFKTRGDGGFGPKLGNGFAKINKPGK